LHCQSHKGNAGGCRACSPFFTSPPSCIPANPDFSSVLVTPKHHSFLSSPYASREIVSTMLWLRSQPGSWRERETGAGIEREGVSPLRSELISARPEIASLFPILLSSLVIISAHDMLCRKAGGLAPQVWLHTVLGSRWPSHPGTFRVCF